MKIESQKFIYIIAHLPKTGGQTLRNHFTVNLKLHEEFIHLGPWGLKQEKQAGLVPFSQRSFDLRQMSRVILGHMVTWQTQALVPTKEPRHIIFLRDPAERIISLYNFHMRSFPDSYTSKAFNTWYQTIPKNSICRWIIFQFWRRKFLRHEINRLNDGALFEIANEILSYFWLVGLTEHLDSIAEHFLKKLNVPLNMERKNVAGMHFPRQMRCTDSIRARIYRDHLSDWKLYRLWKPLIERKFSL